MTGDDVRALADDVLMPILGPVGFAYSDVVEREDSVGDDAFYVTVHMAPEAEYQPNFRYSDALMAMQDALVERGERRFAYLKYDFPSDPAPPADDDEDRMTVARHALVRGLIDVAEILARQAGRPALRQAALRRSVSTVYYAVFHALCAVCSDGLVRWSRTDLVDRTYRALDHGSARRRLAALAAMAGSDPALKRFSTLFNLLQDSRHEADYERPRVLFSQAEALLLLQDGREAIDLLVAMDEDARRRLAVELLVAKSR